MSILNILTNDNPILRKPCEDIPYLSKNIKKLIQDMKDTMIANNGIGLAAPQIGLNINLIVVGDSQRQMELINPVIIEKSENMVEDIEECLSFPNEKVSIKRHKQIKVKYMNKNGKTKIISAQDILAVCLQHEIDHLHGIVIIDYK